jgi:hypothetical protein
VSPGFPTSHRINFVPGHNLPYSVGHLRATYLRDVNFMMDTLNGLGRELKAYPGELVLNCRSSNMDVIDDSISNWWTARPPLHTTVYASFDHHSCVIKIGCSHTAKLPPSDRDVTAQWPAVR